MSCAPPARALPAAWRWPTTTCTPGACSCSAGRGPGAAGRVGPARGKAVGPAGAGLGGGAVVGPDVAGSWPRAARRAGPPPLEAVEAAPARRGSRHLGAVGGRGADRLVVELDL